MRCRWQDATEPDEAGRRLIKCVRAGCTNKRVTAVSHDRYHAKCKGQPLPDDPPGSAPQPPPHGPGTESARLFKELDIKPTAKCQCAKRQRQMDEWGVEGCEDNRDTIVEWFQEAASEQTLSEKIEIASKLYSTDWWSPWRPYGSILDEAIRAAKSRTPPEQ